MDGQLILERYRPLEDLGEGGFGSVVLAWDTRMQRRVAIKRMPLPLDAHGVPERPPGLTEARTAALLNHPAIVTVFDFDTDADEAFIVMEHLDGLSVADLLDRIDGPLTLDECATIADSVAAALEFAHDNGVLHLDIKPDNVLITRDGRVKVADFGVAELSSMSGHGPAWGGTPGYMPLEQLEGRAVSELTDEWAFAALVYEALTGRRTYDSATAPEAMIALRTDAVVRPSHLVTGLPHQLDSVVLTALSISPPERYASVSAFADALQPHLGDIVAGAQSLAELIDEYVEEPADEDAGLESVGMWDRLGGRLGSLLLRAVAAVEAGWLAWSGLMPFALDGVALAAAVGLVTAAGALAPSLGVGLGLGCLIAGVYASGAWVTGTIVLIAGVVWWWLLARRSTGAAVLPLAAPVLSVVSLGLAQPLLAGFALTPLAAAVTALLGGVLTALASAVSVSAAPYLDVWAPYMLNVWSAELAGASIRALVTSWPAYVALAGWPLAAFIMSVACSRATRLGAVVGAVGGAAALAGSYLLAEYLANGVFTGGQWAGNGLAVRLVASLILMLLVAMLGAPIRAEKDDPPPDDAAFRG